MTELIPPSVAAGLESGRRKSTLAFALLCLPRERREDMLIFYRFCRIVDDVADSEDLELDLRRNTLAAWRAALQGEQPLPDDLTGLIERRALDRELLTEIVRGVEMDLEIQRYATFEDLSRYCWRVAGAVGLASLPILGANPQRARAYAESLGMALQLTNILRDVGEDAGRGRVYLPQEDLAHFRVTEDDILHRNEIPAMNSLFDFQAERARSYFSAAADALPGADRAALKAPRIMHRLYGQLLDRMEAGGFHVLTRRYHLSRLEKILLALPILVR